MTLADSPPLLSREVPAGTPRLASWWWRALLVGGSIGLVPLLAVLWHFGDAPVAAWTDAWCPGLLRWLGALLSAPGWMLAVALVSAWCASTQRPERARELWMALACMAVAWALCAALHGVCAAACWMGSRGGAAWSHLSPSAVCAVVTALAAWAFGRGSSARWPLAIAAALACVADVADGVAFASDAIAGAWLGFAATLLVPWARGMRATAASN